MDKTDLAYAAGIVDGEGCIGLYHAHPSHSPHATVLTVKVTNTKEELLQWLKTTFGGSARRESPRKKPCKQSWYWVVAANQALKFLKLVYPYLRLKKPQAEVAIKFQELKFRVRGHELLEEEKTVVEALKEQMSNLNK